MKKFYIFLFVLFASCSKSSNSASVIIDEDWSIQGLEFNKSTTDDFLAFAKKRNLTFHVDSTSYMEEINHDSIEYCGNDYRLQDKVITYKNDSLGITFKFNTPIEAVNQQNAKPTFSQYELANFTNIKFTQDLQPIINQKTLSKFFKKDSLLNAIDMYEAESEGNAVTAGIIKKGEDTYELKILIGYKKNN